MNSMEENKQPLSLLEKMKQKKQKNKIVRRKICGRTRKSRYTHLS